MILKVFKKKPQIKNTFSLILEKPTGFRFYAGQYLDIELPVKDKLGSTRAFTISASPTENFLMITTKKGITAFKKYFANLKKGDEIKASHPAGTFILDETESAVFIAGGIGITPFRSMIKYAIDHKFNTPITLIYSNSGDNFLFKGELDEWQKQLPNLNLHYVITNKQGRLNAEKLKKLLYPKPYTLNPIYYLAGPPKMVDEFEKNLLDLGVDEINIRYDRFDGY